MSNYSDSQFNFSDPNNSWKMTFDRIPEKAQVLDIGCSSGNFAYELIRQKQCTVDGIEINPDDAKAAEKILRNVYVVDIERDELPTEKYDIIFMGDVVEHLARPIPTLKRLRTLLKKDGQLVFSIPNITHMLVRMMLLKGTVEYGKTGLLDETHLHFYNQTEVFRVFNAAGYTIDNIDYVERDVPLEVVKSELEPLGLTVGSLKAFQDLLHSTDAAAYQFVGAASVSKNDLVVQELPIKSPIVINDVYLEQLRKEHKATIQSLEARIVKARAEAHDWRNKYHEAVQSNSYRIGRKATYPLRALKAVKRRTDKSRENKIAADRIVQVLRNDYGLEVDEKGARQHILLVVHDDNHPTSSVFIRLLALFAVSRALKRSKLAIRLVSGAKPSVNQSTKLVVVQRTALESKTTAVNLIKQVKERGVQLFVDTDDAFNSINKSHPEYEQYSERVEALNYVIDHADGVWFSTEPLKKVYAKKSGAVVRNTVDPRLWRRLKAKTVKKVPSDAPLEMVYMGTRTHDNDLKLIMPALERLQKTYPEEFRLHIIGVASSIDDQPWIVKHQPTDGLYPNFVSWFNGLQAFDIGLSPLEDTDFNRNKSDIKCLDYLAVGAKPVVSDVEPYANKELNKLIVRVKNTPEAWYAAIEKEIRGRKRSRTGAVKRVTAGYDYIHDKRTPKSTVDVVDQVIMHTLEDA